MKKKLIGIIGAMDIEIEGLCAILTSAKNVEIGGIAFTTGKLGLQKVVIAKSGIGKVFAAICTQTMINEFSPDMIVNTGIAGTLNEDVGILDVVVANRTVQHDMDISSLDDVPVGLIPAFDDVYLNCDDDIAKRISRAATSLGIRNIIGTVASGDQFIADAKKKEWIKNTFSADACEMEGAAIGQVCTFRKTPFCIVRTISDGGNEAANMDYPKFAKLAADQSVKIVRAFVEGLAE